jgi:leucyl/phenylalanyl-tRNA--protein transferase
MPLEYQFPDPRKADADGLLAVGGDLSIESLLTAYSKGIFPWYDEHSPILWWSPDPRLILYPSRFKVSESLKQKIQKGGYEVTIDSDFRKVIRQCASVPRKGQKGTWLTQEMINAYIELHDEGFAHSFEIWQEGNLVGGLYGISLGKAFFGESMFHMVRDASKLAFNELVNWMIKNDFHFIDAQQSTSHLKSLGAEEVSRDCFLIMLEKALKHNTIRGKWMRTT